MKFLNQVFREQCFRPLEKVLVAFIYTHEPKVVHLTQDQMATALGVPLRTFTRSLVRLAKMGVVRRIHEAGVPVGYTLTHVDNWRLKRPSKENK